MIITKSAPFTKEEIEKRNKEILGAISLDLKRVSLGYQRGNNKMVEIFIREALKRKKELNSQNLKSYLNNFLGKIESLKEEKNDKAAEDALMYSTIFQNASQS